MPRYDIDVIPPHISHLVEKQFQPFYLEEQSLFVNFMVAYYQWLEQEGNPLYYNRNFLNITDVDQSFDQFLILIKEKFLKNIKFNTRANLRQIIKHATDIYRSKGTERAVDLLFRLVFEEAVDFYYPKNDLFKTSDGVWFRPRYLELSLSYYNRYLFNKKIIGVHSGATAFVDSVIRRTFKNHLIDLAYISAIDGTFITGEFIKPTDESLERSKWPNIIGSLNSVLVDAAGAHFAVGDIVNIQSENGDLALGRIAEILDESNQIDGVIVEGGYGYSSTSNVITSNVILQMTVSNITNSYSRYYFDLFDTITQPLASITYSNANGTFAVGDYVQTYHANNDLKGNGQILELTTTNSTSGSFLASIIFGELNQDPFFKTSNAIVANLTAFVNATATGQFLGIANVHLILNNVSGSFAVGEDIIQYNELFDNTYPYRTGTILNIDGDNLQVEPRGYDRTKGIIGQSSLATANIEKVVLQVGVVNANNTYVNTANSFYTAPSVNGTIENLGPNLSVDFNVVNSLAFAETVQLNTDLLETYQNTALNAATYNLPANTSANSSSIMGDVLTFANTSIGKVTSIMLTSLGTSEVSKNFLPIIKVHEPTYANRYDYWLAISNATSSFANGEVITQSATNGRGMILQSNSTMMLVQNMRYYTNNSFVVTSNATTRIVGSNTAAAANVTAVSYRLSPFHMGFNASITANTVVANGVITDVQVIDSGFGFIQGESVTITKDDTSSEYAPGQGFAQLTPPGVGSGFYKVKGGFLSSQKKIFDGYYWQEYSYEISSSRTLDKYQKLLKNLVHVAGTALFGRLVYKSVANSALSVVSTGVESRQYWTSNTISNTMLSALAGSMAPNMPVLFGVQVNAYPGQLVGDNPVPVGAYVNTTAGIETTMIVKEVTGAQANTLLGTVVANDTPGLHGANTLVQTGPLTVTKS